MPNKILHGGDFVCYNRVPKLRRDSGLLEQCDAHGALIRAGAKWLDFRSCPVIADVMRAYSEFHMNDKEQCHQVVLDFCVAINNWGDTFTTVKRIANGQFVSEARRIAVNGQTVESCLLEHAQIFQAFVVPRERKFGTNPGQPNSWSRSTFFDVSADGITAVAFPAKRRCEVSTEWGYLLPSGQTKFVLKLNAGRWLIDSLKSRHTSSDKWRVMHI